MRMRDLRTLLDLAANAAQDDINANAASGSLHARGLSSEGFAGGYREALYDVIGLLDHGRPADSRGYWRKAVQAKAKRHAA